MTSVPVGEYKVILLSEAGVKLAEVTEFTQLSYQKQVNSPGLLKMDISGTSPKLDLFQQRRKVEVWRRLPRLTDYYRDFVGIIRGLDRWNDNGLDRATVTAYGLLSMLDWRIVAWAAGTAGRNQFTGYTGESIMKSLVAWNAGPCATVSEGRVKDGIIPGLGVCVNQDRGAFPLNYACAWKNLLTCLQELAPLTGGDFDISLVGLNDWRFEYYPNQRGTDKSATLIFSLERGNMTQPHYSIDYTTWSSAAVVAGQGWGADRQIDIRTGPGFTANYDDYEVFVDSNQTSTIAGLDAAGDTVLNSALSLEQFTFQPIQVNNCLYGVHYILGDLVTGQYKSVSKVLKVNNVSVTANSDGSEQIQVGLK